MVFVRAMAQRKTLLIVDDDVDLRGAIAEQLQAEGFETVEAGAGGEGVRLAAEAKPDRMLREARRPGVAAREVCKPPPARAVDTPVIMLAAADTDEDTIKGMASGANAYVTKPYKFPVLLTRIRAQLRD